MRIIKDQQIVEDTWRFVDEGDAAGDGNVIVPFRRWCAEPELRSAHAGELAIWVDGDDDVQEVSRAINVFALIGVKFPVFSDGRSFTLARILRERYRYRGEIRALGDVARDQLQFMARCGIDSFALRESDDFDAALDAFSELSCVYQHAADDAVPVRYIRDVE